MDRVTPQELHAELDRVRRQKRLAWWQVAVQADVSEVALRQLKHGRTFAYYRASAWLERHTSPPRQV
jgi:hypothetical protein